MDRPAAIKPIAIVLLVLASLLIISIMVTSGFKAGMDSVYFFGVPALFLSMGLFGGTKSTPWWVLAIGILILVLGVRQALHHQPISELITLTAIALCFLVLFAYCRRPAVQGWFSKPRKEYEASSD